MEVNKVVYGNNTLIDLTQDTVTSSTLLQGETAHDASGTVITGSYVPTITWNDIIDKPATFTPSSHIHVIADVTNLQTTLDNKANNEDIPVKTSDLVNDSGFITTVGWDDVNNKPSTFTPSSHTHPSGDITGLGSAAVANAGHDAWYLPVIGTIPLAEKPWTPVCTTASGNLISRNMVELISTSTVTISPGAISSGGYLTGTTNVTKSGWTPIGIIGKHASTRYLHTISMYLTNAADGSGRLNWMFHASGSAVAAGSTLEVDVLWVRS